MQNEFTNANKKQIKLLQKVADLVLAKESIYQAMTNAQLQSQTTILKQRLEKGESLDAILPDAYAVCREAAWRVVNMKHFPVQVLGGIALHQGRICQMATGEGKTLVSTLPAYLNALTGKGVHIVTVNDYLAKRDAEWMGKIHRFLGLTVGVVYSHQPLQEKLTAYKCDITYGTNNEFGFDYLRDNMATRAQNKVQRALNFVIIDEVDSILIDEARTPLIISGRSQKSSEGYVIADKFIRRLKKDVDYEVDEKDRQVHLTESGIEMAEKFYNIENLGDIENTEINHYIICALKAHAIMKRDDNYIVDRGQIIIVDEFTGRKMIGRRFSGGLHQAIEAKEKVAIKEEDRTLATITFQNFFRLYNKLSGMTGTAKTEEEEFNDIYNLDVVVIPTNLPNARIDYPDKIFKTREGKLSAAVEEIVELHQKGQPLLIGTATVEKSEELSSMLSRRGVMHNVLNAKNHLREAEMVAQAGKLGAVTIATNMAGRGTDILLGGNPEFLAKQEMLNLGYSAEEVEESTSFIEGDERVEKLKETYRELFKKHETKTNKEKEKVIELGGLHILGTERHESRRIDNQLRGRSGRQGDCGSSVFYVSAQDEMMRVFGGERLGNILTAFNVPDDMPIQSKMLANQLEAAQKKVESRNYSVRKNVLKFDDVNNVQRNTIYGIRNKILDNADIHDEILNMAQTYARKALEDACDGNEKVKEWDIPQVNETLRTRYYPFKDMDFISLEAQTKGNARLVLENLTELTKKMLEARKKNLAEEQDIDFSDLEKYILLKVIDEKWMDHLDAMDQLRQGVGLQSIGQHDPIATYKKESFEMFEALMDDIHSSTLKYLMFAKIQKHQRPVAVLQKQKVYAEGEQPSLNDPCPCGSGQKYKNCHGKELAEKLKKEWKEKKGKK